jgi:hypothetical protein
MTSTFLFLIRAILEQRGKLINEHKQSVEGMVEKLSAQLSEKDFAVEEMRRSRQVEESFPSLNVCTSQNFKFLPLRAENYFADFIGGVSRNLRSGDRQGQ